MEKIKLIILFFSCLSLAQVETYSSSDIVLIEKKGDSLFNAKNFTKASEYFKKLISIDSENFYYNFKYASSYGLHVESLPRFQQVKHVRDMVKYFENSLKLKPNHLGVNRALLEIYLRVPRLFGGGNKKAKKILDNIYSISVFEGKKAEIFFNNY